MFSNRYLTIDQLYIIQEVDYSGWISRRPAITMTADIPEFVQELDSFLSLVPKVYHAGSLSVRECSANNAIEYNKLSLSLCAYKYVYGDCDVWAAVYEPYSSDIKPMTSIMLLIKKDERFIPIALLNVVVGKVLLDPKLLGVEECGDTEIEKWLRDRYYTKDTGILVYKLDQKIKDVCSINGLNFLLDQIEGEVYKCIM